MQVSYTTKGNKGISVMYEEISLVLVVSGASDYNFLIGFIDDKHRPTAIAPLEDVLVPSRHQAVGNYHADSTVLSLIWI